MLITQSPKRPMRRRGFTVAAAALAGALLLSSCAADTAPATAGGEPVSGGTLTYGRAAAVTDLDPNTQISANNAFAIDKIFEPLVSFNEAGEIEPWLATYTEGADGTEYVFMLREGLKFSNGEPVTPADVVFSLERHIEVVGPAPLNASITSIEATGDRDVTITLAEPYTPFLSELAGFSNGVFPAEFGGVAEEEFFKNPVGTGPFVVSEWDPTGDLTFVKNEHYWQDGKPFIDELVYKFVADDTQLRQQLAAGQLDAIENVPAANAAEIDNAENTVLTRAPGWMTDQVFFNTQREELADPHVRRAIAHAIDREGIVTATTFGTAEVANVLLPSNVEYSANSEGFDLPFDMTEAESELAKSAYPDGFEIALMVPSGNTQRAQIAEIMQESLGKIGITVTIDSPDIATFRERFKAYDYDIMINQGQLDSPDPNGFITFQADPEGFSKSFWTHFTNDRVTELMHEGQTTPEGDAREAIYFEIQEILAQEAPYVPLFFPANLKATTVNVHGFTVLPNGSVRMQDAWLSE